tara:strand:- start:41 stop:781 length:741 start_codon:yes stop_codon:yes gene_type:complete
MSGKRYPEGAIRFIPVGNSGTTQKKVNGKWVTIYKDRSEYKVPKNTPIGKSGPRPELRELCYGVGINDVMIPYFTETKTWRTWSGIIRRSGKRDPNMHNYESYKDCTLDTKWYKLSAFKEWIEQWDDYKNKEVDKDILIPGNLHYGPDTCLMVRRVVNAWFKPHFNHGDLPRGVTWNSSWRKTGKGKPYRAQITPIGGKRTHLGYFDTIEEASAVFESERIKQIDILIETETDLKVKNAIINHLKK